MSLFRIRSRPDDLSTAAAPGALRRGVQAVTALFYQTAPLTLSAFSVWAGRPEIVGGALTAALIFMVVTHDTLQRRDLGLLSIRVLTGLLVAVVCSLFLHGSVAALPVLGGSLMAGVPHMAVDFNERRKEGRYLNHATLYASSSLLMMSVFSAGWGSFAYLNPQAVNAGVLIPDARQFWTTTYALQAAMAVAVIVKTVLLKRPASSPRLERILNMLLGCMNKAAGLQNVGYFLIQAGLYFKHDESEISPEINRALFALSAGLGLLASRWIATDELDLAKKYKKIADQHVAAFPLILPAAVSSTRRFCQPASAVLVVQLLMYLGELFSAVTQSRQIIGVAYPDILANRVTSSSIACVGLFGLVGGLHEYCVAKREQDSRLPAWLFRFSNQVNKANTGVSTFSNVAYTLTFFYGALTFRSNVPIHVQLAQGDLPIFAILDGALLVAAIATATTAASMARVIAKGRKEQRQLRGGIPRQFPRQPGRDRQIRMVDNPLRRSISTPVASQVSAQVHALGAKRQETYSAPSVLSSNQAQSVQTIWVQQAADSSTSQSPTLIHSEYSL